MRPLLLLAVVLAAAQPVQAQWRLNATGAPGDSRPDRLAVDGLTVAVIQQGGGSVLTSRDGGITATRATSTALPVPVDQVAVGGGAVYASNGSVSSSTPTRGLHRSSDGGATWTNVTAGLVAAFGRPTFSVRGVGVDGATVYASVDDNGIPGTQALYQSPDGGATWTRAALQPGFRGFTRLFRQAGALYVFALDGVIATLWRSADDGATWAEITPPMLRLVTGPTIPAPQDVYGTSDAASGALYIGGRIRYPASAASYDGYPLFRSLDGGTTWTRLYTPLEGPDGPRPHSPVRIQSLAVVGSTLAATVVSNTSEAQQLESGLWLSADGGLTWQRPVRTKHGVRYDNASQMNTQALAANVGGLLYTNDGTAAPSALAATPDPVALATTTDSLRATLSGVRIRAGALLTSSTPGRDSLFVRRNVAGNAPPTGVSDPFSGTAGPPFPPFPSMMDDTWSLTVTGAVGTWLRFSNPVYDFPFDPAFVPNPAALVLLRRAGTGWYRLTTGVTVRDGFVRYATTGSEAALGPADYTLGSTDPANTFGGATASEPGGPAGGVTLRLAGANPVRGAVRFTVSLDASGPATLVVCDALGREVARQSVAGGEAQISAGRLAPGVYVARLESAGRSAVRRFTISR